MMARIKAMARRATKAPGVPQARHLAERTVAPYLRADLQSLNDGLTVTAQRTDTQDLRILELQRGIAQSHAAVRSLEDHMPAVLNAINSTNGTSRLLRRELTATREKGESNDAAVQALHTTIADVDEHWRSAFNTESAARIAAEQAIRTDFGQHIETLAWLVQRVELIRAETLNELRYGAPRPSEDHEVRIVNADALGPDKREIRLNLGCGHLPLDGFVNVDMRPLPGVDVVAPVDRIPVDPGAVDEIFSAHTLEHFPEEQLRRTLLPYWFGLLRPGGTFRAVVPDLDAMAKGFAGGDIEFDAFRLVAYGGQEYEGDFHLTGFTPTSMSDLLRDAGFVDVEVIASGRRNGASLECEVAGRRPAP